MKGFLKDNVTRCCNDKCTKRNNCKRFAQWQIEKSTNTEIDNTAYFSEKGCTKLMKF